MRHITNLSRSALLPVALITLVACGGAGEEAPPDGVETPAAAETTPVRREPDATQQVYASPEEAVDALVAACRTDDEQALLDVLGHSFEHLVNGLDPVTARQDRTAFADAADARTRLVRESDERVTVLIGGESWPLPIPIVRQDDSWRFDTAAGEEEVLNRRVGEHELRTIETLDGLVAAQFEYAATDHDGDDVLEYAQRFASTANARDGLFWTASGDPDEPPSPIDELLASAGGSDPSEAWWGYRYKLLRRQGARAPGGAYDYVINDNMIAGFAFLAYPARYGSSGVMSFLVSHHGRVHQADLGSDSATAAAQIDAFDPGADWEPVVRD